jgi:hypothetical protein
LLESYSETADTTSVIAARQLAGEAHRRRLPPDLLRRRRRPLVVPPLPDARPPSDAVPEA